MKNDSPFNPLQMENLAESVAKALLSRNAHPLSKVPKFAGAGLYAIYYAGSFPAYSRLAAQSTKPALPSPIYVGKAVAKGSRKGLHTSASTFALSSRLREHAQSIAYATNLDVADFSARWLVVEPIWIGLGETMLIGRFAPVWNGLVDGFGNHNPGSKRMQTRTSRWDTLHPGRPWVRAEQVRIETAGAIGADVTEYLRSRLGD